MKYEITHLKAPWPEGAKVGDVFDAGPSGLVPAWAQGKVKPAGDQSAKATIKLEKREPAPGEDEDGPVEANTPEGKKQQAAENVEQKALRRREEKNPSIANGGAADQMLNADGATTTPAKSK